MVQIFPILNIPIIKENDDLVQIILRTFNDFQDNDLIVIAHTIISRIEGREEKLDSITPSQFAIDIAKRANKDPKIIEVILRESKSIVRMSDTLLICETRHGFICANAGIDRSNATANHVLTLPIDPDKS